MGNRGGPGNPFARRVAAIRSALCASITEKDIRELALQLLAQAKNGDLAAAKLLFAYAIGRPIDVVDPDTLDVKEWQLLQQAPMNISEMERLFSGLPTPLANAVVRAAWPAVGRDLALQLAEGLKKRPPADK